MNLRTLLQPLTKRHYFTATTTSASETTALSSSGNNGTTHVASSSSSGGGVLKSWFSTCSSSSSVKPPEISQTKLDWLRYADRYQTNTDFHIISFNMLAPVYKRLSTIDITTGYRKREAQNPELWKARAAKTLQFFRDEIFNKADIISLQEFWLDDRYLNIFQSDFQENQYDIYLLQRTGRKLDAVAILVKKTMFDVLAVENIYLCTLSDRVALLLWLRHRITNKDILVANTHLSFPHNQLDKVNQMKQMKNLTCTMDRFAKENQLSKVTCMIMGDFNVESNSPVCDHLRNNGYHSCFEVQPPQNTIVPEEAEMVAEKLTELKPSQKPDVMSTKVNFVSHRNHQAEDVGVDHIFIRPENLSSIYFHHIHEIERQEQAKKGIKQEEDNNEEQDDDKEDNEDDDDDDKENYVTIKTHFKEKLFIDSCHVLPSNLSCRIWNEKFTLSDHRPITAKVVFAKKKKATATKK